MVAAIQGISVFLAVIGCIVLAGWVAEQIAKDVQKSRRARRRQRH
jgi:hypothetical protein